MSHFDVAQRHSNVEIMLFEISPSDLLWLFLQLCCSERLSFFVFSVWWFGNMVAAVNMLGMALVFAGVFAYGSSKAAFNSRKAKEHARKD